MEGSSPKKNFDMKKTRVTAQDQKDDDTKDTSLYSFNTQEVNKYDLPSIAASNHVGKGGMSPKKRRQTEATKRFDESANARSLEIEASDRAVSPPKLKSMSPTRKAPALNESATLTFLKKTLSLGETSTNITSDNSNREFLQDLGVTTTNTYSPSKKIAMEFDFTDDGGADSMSPRIMLKTGEDAISFFARYGAESAVKFVHLNQADTGITFRPYELVVVSSSETHPEFFTMSSAGLVHVSPGNPSEFIPLSEWMRQSTMFNVISNIRFFKHYLIYKTFFAWRNNVRYRLFIQQQKKLASRLFLGKQSFSEPLIEVKSIMMEISNVMLLDLRVQKTYELNAFLEFQASKRADASKEFESCIEKLQAVVQKLCTNVNNLAKRSNTHESILEEHGLGAQKNKSITASKLEQQERKRLLIRASEEASMLPTFIQLVDYIAVENLVGLAIQSCNEFLLELIKTPRKTGLFETTISFGDESTLFTPTKEDVQSQLITMTDAMINTVNSVSRILYLRQFSQYIPNASIEGPYVGSTIRANAQFKRIRANIDRKVGDDYNDAEDYVHIFDSVRPIYEYDKEWNFEEYSHTSHTITSLRADMLKISTWEKELEKMRVGHTIGILHVESRKLKQTLIPMTTAKLDSIKNLVKDLARSKCKNQLNDYKQRIQIIVQRPQHLKEFAGYVEKLQSLKANQKSLSKNTNVVDEMYRLLGTYGVRISSEDMVQLDDLRSVQESYKNDNDASELFIQERTGEMASQLDVNIARLNDQVVQVQGHLEGGVFIDPTNYSNPQPVFVELEITKQKLNHLDELAKQYHEYENLFGIAQHNYKALVDTKEYYKLVESLWTNVQEWNTKYIDIMTKDFVKLNVEDIAKDVAVFFKSAFSLHKKLQNEVTNTLNERTAEFKLMIPTILELGNPAMKDRHWEKIFKALNQPWFPGITFTLENLISFDIFELKDLISEVSGVASGEAQIESSLESIKQGWDNMDFVVLSHREQQDVYIIGGLEDIFTRLEDNQVTLQTMMGSRFILGVKEEVEKWDKKLSLLSETLDEWVTCQRNWMYLETIFSAEDIKKQLPMESQKFQLVNKTWKGIMLATHEKPNVISCVEHGEEMLEQFHISNNLLEEIQKSLEDYLETKRMAFPRFYFLSNDELLEILSQTRNPKAVQPHLVKCFDAMKSIVFDKMAGSLEENELIITAMVSGEGERVKFSTAFEPKGPVEMWLTLVEKSMKESLYDETRNALNKYPVDDTIHRGEWIFSFPAQVVILIDQVYWTQNVTRAITQIEEGVNPKALKDFLAFSLAQIDAMVGMVRGELTKLQRICMGALITIDVHARDVVRSLIAKEISMRTDFEWTRQLRYYWETDIDNCTARQTNTRFVYAYEYLGNSPRLVITPLTDICYMTLTGALHLRLGGAPAGPAGTGKTETTKDLAKALAVQCVVFNCSDGLDYKIMGRFFSGLAQAGSWACFDEFNRIDIEVLSVIAQQMLCIQQAMVMQVDRFEFEGNLIQLKTGFGVFITMNPGYAGRTELPDNLKALFRPVAMMVPDYRLIAEIVLFSEGFANALPLSNKMTQLYSLASEQLSKQDHYDFGMRAVKSVLVAAGQLKRKEPETTEDLLLIRAMRDSNVPKFLEEDLPLFRGILTDLFPGVNVPFVDYGLLQKSIETQLKNEKLQCVPSFISKAIQIHETQLVRHGMMVVGETGSGKTSACRILAQALTSLHEQGVSDRDGYYQIVNRLILNPKSITAGQLYGEFNLLTNEWTDGLVPKLVRQCVQDAAESTNRKWIIFDGPVDAVWIENMNTVLDDNKTLCLANSERIKLPSTLHMMFEVQDLKVASPATVSRCGMVFMEQVHVGVLSLAATWKDSTLAQLLPNRTDLIFNLITEHLPVGMKFLRSHCKEKIPSNDMNLMQSFLNLYTSCLSLLTSSAALREDDTENLIHMYFMFSFVWSVGANVDEISRARLNEFCTKQFSRLMTSYGGIIDNFYGYTVDQITRKWVSWVQKTPEYNYDPSCPYFSMLVPTQDTTRLRYLLERLLCSNHNVLYSGETGVGKSVIIQRFLDDMIKTEAYVGYTMTYSAQTKPFNLREEIEMKLEKKRKNLLGPPSGKQMLFFIDDLNIPALEVYGAQPPNELLRQVIDSGGFYDTGKLFFKNIKDVVFVAACAPPGGGRNEVSPRLLRHFHMLWIPNLEDSAMTKIFVSILQGFVNHKMKDLASLPPQIVQASVELYRRVEKDMLPTPSKSHYTFNLRDLSKVFQGMLMVAKENVPDRSALVRLWLHEQFRVFRDRLVNEEDVTWFNSTCQSLLMQHLQLEWKIESFEDITFGDYMSRESKRYCEIQSMDKFQNLLVEYLEEYNMSFSSKMHLVFFKDAMAHISRVARVLRQPRGNALLIGVGGSGRQSLARLAAFMADYQCFSIEITRGYGPNEFHEDLKKVLLTAGTENKPVVFLFSDAQIVVESFLEDINNILNTGGVPNLFAPDEMERIISTVRPLAEAAGLMGTREEILAHYITLVRENLHVVLAFSPIGAGFRNRCRMFPSFVNCCTIDWFRAWPEDALNSVASKFLTANAESLGIKEYVPALCRMAVIIHRSVEEATVRYYNELKRRNYTTPTSYLELIRLYVDMLGMQRGVVRSKEAKYRIGLKKLAETEQIVSSLQNKLTELQPVLVEAQKNTADLLVQIVRDQEEADKQQVFVEADVKAANKIADEVKTIKDDCQRDLDEAMPAYHASIKALQNMKKDDITMLKSFANPPRLVGVTMNAVCCLFQVKQDWGEAKKLLNDIKFLDKLKDFDKDNIPTKVIRQLAKFIEDDEFTPDTLKSISTAATSLCMWAHAMFTYNQVAKNIEPKRAKLATAEEQLANEQAKLDQKQESLHLVLAKVAALQANLAAAQAKKKDLEVQSGTTETRLRRAEELLDSLSAEKGRWKECAESLSVDMQNLMGDMILSAGHVAYLGPFTSEFRFALTTQWVSFCKRNEIPVDHQFSLQRILANPVQVREWNILGLPADEFSTQNGMFATMGRRWPLMIDPQGQSNKWIKNMYKDGNLQVIKLNQKDFLRTLENAIRYGAPVLLENVEEELDPSLEPVLLKQVFRRGGQNLLRLGDADVPYSDSFRFYITTKLANPHYMPEICIKVTVINFTVTLKGLEEQLLVDVVRNERPDLEQKKAELTVNIASDKKELQELENKILQMLEESKGNILDDEELIQVLAHSKVKSSAIKNRMTEAEATSKEINDTREGFRVVASRGSLIYFVIATLAFVDPMYQYSLQYYQKLFCTRLENSTKSDDLQKRLLILIEDITTSLFTTICRGLFEKDKLIYAFMMAANILREGGGITPQEWKAYLIGFEQVTVAELKKPCPEWLSMRVWQMLHSMARVHRCFDRIVESVLTYPSKWRKKMIASDKPYEEELSDIYDCSLTNFQKLLVLRVFREEMLVFGARKFVERELGSSFTESPPFDLEGCYNDSKPETPLIFVLSPGADINDYLLDLAKKKGKDGNRLKIISLGQGQGPIAEAMMEQARKTGDWVCLQNCHLAVSWLGRLEQILEKSVEMNVHVEYRLWLTSMPSNKFPVPVLQNGIKITNEPPKGIKANLKRTFLDIKVEDYEACSKGKEFKKFIFALAVYNALCLERRKFGAIGWNIPYEWMNSDLKTGMQQVHLYLEEQEEIPYTTLNVMVADITYGGRITDGWDKRANSSIMKKLFCPELMSNDYYFSECKRYYAPKEGNLEATREYVNGLPTVDAPDLFGLHANADITYQQKETKKLLDTIIIMGGGSSGGGAGNENTDEIVSEMVVRIQDRMPDLFNASRGHPDTFRETSNGAMNSLGVFLFQEMIRFNGLIRVMKSTLETLGKAIKGLVVMSASLENMYHGFLIQKVPIEWEKAGYPCLKPLSSWIDDFFARVAFLENWLSHGPPPAFWLPGFFFPQGFMTAVKQTFSREHRIAIDTLTVGCKVLSVDEKSLVTGSQGPDSGVYIYGLFMEGARFDRDEMEMAESLPSELFSRMPLLWLKPGVASSEAARDVYSCPLYKTSIRAGTLSTTGHSTNFVVALEIPTKKEPDHWIRRGCAMLCMLDT